MALESSDQSKSKRNSKKKNQLHSDKKLHDLDSLPWNPSLPETVNASEDAFSFFIGSNEFEGGFLALEEIDESEYGFEIPKIDVDINKKMLKESFKSKKRKINNGEDGSGVDSECAPEKNESKVENQEQERQSKTKKKTKKRRKDDKKNDESNSAVSENFVLVGNENYIVEEDSIDEAEYHAWNELRLHPLIMKSIHRLKFKEPTPIQKACIPAAAHQGKDVIGAAETGSGKTLAFGLPILQRLLEEQEKVERLLVEKEVNEQIAAQGVLRALIVTPTRELALQVTDHLKQVAKGTNFRVVPIVGGMSTEKQERILKSRPEIVVGTPGRLWELMSGGEIHLVELHSLSFFVLDEADRMIETGHFRELQSIIDMLPMNKEPIEKHSHVTQSCVTSSSFQKKKRQTFVFSATLALSGDFRKKLKRGSMNANKDELNSMETLSERAGLRPNTAIVDLTNASILANKLTESVIECREEEKGAYLYYILSVHGQGRTLVFSTSISALRRISSILRTLKFNVLTLHSEMQQRARLKAVDRFRANEHGVLVATDAAARGLDIPGIRTVIHYQLPHSAEVYVHRCGRTARAFADGCSIAMISPNEASKFAALCKSFAKENFLRFPIEVSYVSEVMKRSSLAHQIDRIVRKDSQDKAEKSWLKRNAETVELVLEDDDSEDERVEKYRQKKATSNQLKKLQLELDKLLMRPLQPKNFPKRFLAGAGVSPLLQLQFEELARQKSDKLSCSGQNKNRLVVMGQDCVEPLQALRSSGKEACLDLKEIAEKQKNLDNLKKKKKEMKKRMHEQRRKQRKKLKQGN